MTDRIRHLRPLDGEEPVVLTPPPQHLAWLLRQVAKDFEEGEWTRGVDNLAHSVYVAATKGLEGLDERELVYLIRKVCGTEFDPSDAA